MTPVYFKLNSEEDQSIIEHSVKDDVSKNILTTVFNQLMENQRIEYIQADYYERSRKRQSQRMIEPFTFRYGLSLSDDRCLLHKGTRRLSNAFQKLPNCDWNYRR